MVEQTAIKWWQKAVFYQIYPRSFADGNGDGIGDLAGMTAKLNYLQELGIDAIWLSPHYPSPFVDCGYDVADYRDVGPEYGTLENFKQYLNQVHQRGMRLVLDMVLNHTSDQHPWFIESRSSRDNPKRDWYIWQPPGKPASSNGRGKVPNNWQACCGFAAVFTRRSISFSGCAAMMLSPMYLSMVPRRLTTAADSGVSKRLIGSASPCGLFL